MATLEDSGDIPTRDGSMPKLFFYGDTGNTFVEEIIREKRKNGKNKENIFGFRSKTT